MTGYAETESTKPSSEPPWRLRKEQIPNALRALVVILFGLALFVSWKVQHAPYQPFPYDFAYSESDYELSELPVVALDRSLSFAKGANRPALLRGWSMSEPWGVWTDGNAAYLAFRPAPTLSAMDESLVLSLTGKAYIVPDMLPRQEIRVWVNGHAVETVKLQNPEADISVPLDGVRMDDSAPIIVALELATVASPDAVQNIPDPRLLAFGIESLTIRKASLDER